jgi:hypothetical protein
VEVQVLNQVNSVPGIRQTEQTLTSPLNASRSNVLKFAISGAPASGIIVDNAGQSTTPFDGIFFEAQFSKHCSYSFW